MSAPLAPRDYGKLAWIPTSGNAFGGFPGCGTVFNNTLVYPYGTYTVDSSRPQIRLFDGVEDHFLTDIPDVFIGASWAYSKAIVSMLTANGTVYVSTFDSGTSSTDWAGRVFQLNPDNGDLTVLGDAVFTGGDVPYALAWHLGRLWVGTHTGDMTKGSKIYFLRPGIDTAWTLDETFAGGSVFSGVTAMLSYKGDLYATLSVGSAGGTRQSFLMKRDIAGAWTANASAVSPDSGATVDTNSAVISMCEFGGNLYMGYFGGVSGTKKSLIRKWDGSSMSTVYTGSSTTIIPYAQLFVDNGKMYAIGGGPSGLSVKQAVLLSTPDGTAYTNLSAQLLGTATALPLHAVIAF